MDELKKTVAKNLTELRRSAGMTQLELAEKLNYSDKAVSKWESGASLPDVTVLYQIAKLYGVTVDYLLSEEHKIPIKEMVHETMVSRRHLIITLMSVVLAWLIATACFTLLSILDVKGMLWLCFVWPVPISMIIILIFNSIWGKPRANYIIISLLIWSFLASVYLSLIKYNNYWLIFTVGIPGQLIVALWSGMFRKSSPRFSSKSE